MELTPDPKILIDIVTQHMPYGKYKGYLIGDVPESYLVWCKQKDAFPKGRLGMLMQTVYEIKLNGLDYLIKDLKQLHRK